MEYLIAIIVSGGRRLGEERPETRLFWLVTETKKCTVSCRERKPSARGCIVKSSTSAPKKSTGVAAGAFQSALARV